MKSPGIHFLESLLTMASVTMAGTVLVVGGILVFSINARQLSYGHE